MNVFRTVALALAAAAAAGPRGAVAEPNGGKVFDELFFGTQYYRAPTPLPAEWEEDLPKLAGYGINGIQIRVNWRNNERKEDVYDFGDVDRLMDLAEANGQKVVIKFLLECGPQYLFDKYGATRIGHKGELIRGGSHGAFYSGGWIPCFTNPNVARRAAKFVRTLAARYKDRRHLVAWHAWNEPRNRPVGECYCGECRKAFGEYLRGKFGTIERLNDFYGVAEESFERIALPAMPHGYWDIYEFKKFKASACIHANLKMVYDAVRSVDAARPVIAHNGYSTSFMGSLGDCLDDYGASRALDGWGTSVCSGSRARTPRNRMDFNLMCTYLRSIDPNFLIWEIYPGLGMFEADAYDNNWDMDYKLYTGLGNGANALNFWQYRSERLGMEADCAGLARMDGSPRKVLDSLVGFSRAVKDAKVNVLGYARPPAEVAIVFDFDSHLMSCIEESCGQLYDFRLAPEGALAYYGRAHQGFFRTLFANDIPVDYLQSRRIDDIFRYKVAYLPYHTMLDAKVAGRLREFVARGGTLIADEGFGMRQANTWMTVGDIASCGLLKARLHERRAGDRKVVLGDREILARDFHSEYDVEGAETLMSFADGAPAAQRVAHGRGSVCLLGFSLGNVEARGDAEGAYAVFSRLAEDVELGRFAYGRFADGLEEHRLAKGGEELVFLSNANDSARTVRLSEKVVGCSGGGTADGNSVRLPPRAFAIVRVVR